MDTKQDIRDYLDSAAGAIGRGDLVYAGYYIGKAARHWSANSDGIDTDFIMELHEALPHLGAGRMDEALGALNKALDFVQE